MGLQGMTVAVTGSRRASELATLIATFGGVPYVAPTVGIDVQEAADSQLQDLLRRILRGECDSIVFMTGPGVYLLMSKAERLGRLAEAVDRLNQRFIVARSQKPQKVLERFGVRVGMVPAENTAEGIASEMARLDLRGKRVAILWHGSPAGILRQRLEGQGAAVFEAQAYTYSPVLEQRGAEVLEALGFHSVPPEGQKVLELIGDLLAGRVQVLTFTSPPSARNLFRLAEAHDLLEELRHQVNRHVLVVAVGPPTRQAIEEHGILVDVMPETYKLGPMVRAMVDSLAQPHHLRGKRILAEPSPAASQPGSSANPSDASAWATGAHRDT
jgi:uroporphyrinogen-III synthase